MTASVLKLIAVGAMIIDHVGAIFPDHFPFWFRAVGRLAWPIFAYLIAEGFRHTKAPEKFELRLLAFALISEIPFDLAFYDGVNFFANTNIFYTLFLGGTAICIYERFVKRGWQTLAVICSIFPAAILAQLLSVDYGGFGVMFIFVMYLVKNKPLRLVMMTGFVLAQFLPFYMALQMSIAIKFEYLIMIPFALVAVPL